MGRSPSAGRSRRRPRRSRGQQPGRLRRHSPGGGGGATRSDGGTHRLRRGLREDPARPPTRASGTSMTARGAGSWSRGAPGKPSAASTRATPGLPRGRGPLSGRSRSRLSHRGRLRRPSAPPRGGQHRRGVPRPRRPAFRPAFHRQWRHADGLRAAPRPVRARTRRGRRRSCSAQDRRAALPPRSSARHPGTGAPSPEEGSLLRLQVGALLAALELKDERIGELTTEVTRLRPEHEKLERLHLVAPPTGCPSPTVSRAA